MPRFYSIFNVMYCVCCILSCIIVALQHTNYQVRIKNTANRKYGVEVDADRKSLIRNAVSDTASANPTSYLRAMSSTGEKYCKQK